MQKNYFAKINEEYREKREYAQRLSDERKLQLQREIPEIAKIDALLYSTAVKVLSASMSGGNVAEKIAEIRAENENLLKRRRELLRQNGYPEDYSDVKYMCEKCSDSGFVGLDMCSCMKTAISEARLNDSDIGRLAETQSFDSFSFDYYSGEALEYAKRNYKFLKDFAENFKSDTYVNWLLLGDTGLGKTHLSTSVGVTVIKKGYDVVYKSVQSMMDDFECRQFKGESSDITKKYFDCDLLIIDDLGVELINQFTVSCLYNVINTRMNLRRSTIFSTNLKQSELREKYSDRITSRLFGEYKPLLFKGTDIRRQKLTK